MVKSTSGRTTPADTSPESCTGMPEAIVGEILVREKTKGAVRRVFNEKWHGLATDAYDWITRSRHD